METIRQVRPTDVDSLYAISLATGFEGGDASHLYADPRLMGHIYSAPYAVLEPSLALVVEDSRGIAGFAVGAIDTETWESRLESEWWPALREGHADPDEAARESWSADQRRASMIHHPTRTPAEISGRYPAHLHLNLLPHIQGKGVGMVLFENWRQLAVAKGAKQFHVAINRANIGAIRFWKKVGFTELDIDGCRGSRTVWMGRD